MENNKRNAIIRKGSDAIVKREERDIKIAIPLADLYETSDDFVVKLDLPGTNRDSINLTVDSERLTVQAKIISRDLVEMPVYSEIGTKNYFREFRVGYGIDLNGISARFENGVLTITLPKTDEVKAKEIEIK